MKKIKKKTLVDIKYPTLKNDDGTQFMLKYVKSKKHAYGRSRLFTHGPSWIRPEQFSSELLNTGNGFEFSDDHGNLIELNYCQAQELMILLQAEDTKSVITYTEQLKRKKKK